MCESVFKYLHIFMCVCYVCVYVCVLVSALRNQEGVVLINFGKVLCDGE